MTDLTDTYKEVSAQEQNKLLRQQIFLMHQVLDCSNRLEVEGAGLLEAIPDDEFKAGLVHALSVYEHVYNRFLQWLQDNKEMAEFYEREG